MRHLLFLFALLALLLTSSLSHAGFGGSALTGVQTNTLTATTNTAATMQISQIPTNNAGTTVTDTLVFARPAESKYLQVGVRKAPGICPGANSISVFYKQNNTGFVNMGCVAPSTSVLVQMARYLEGGINKVAYRGYPSTGGVFEVIVSNPPITTAQTVTCTGYHGVEWAAAPDPAPVYISTAARSCYPDNSGVLNLFGPYSNPGNKYGYQPGATKAAYTTDWTP